MPGLFMDAADFDSCQFGRLGTKYGDVTGRKGLTKRQYDD
jgi:hypothetical protein